MSSDSQGSVDGESTGTRTASYSTIPLTKKQQDVGLVKFAFNINGKMKSMKSIRHHFSVTRAPSIKVIRRWKDQMDRGDYELRMNKSTIF